MKIKRYTLMEDVKRKEALDKISQEYDSLLEQVLKCVVCRDEIDSVWVQTIGSICDRINKIKVKGGKFERADYKKELVLKDEANDYEIDIFTFWLLKEREDKYFDDENIRDDAVILMRVYEKFIEEVCSVFVDIKKVNYTTEDFSQLFLKVYDKNVRV